MTSTTTTTPAVGTATPKTMRKNAGGRGEGNPAKAGWASKGTLILICFLWIVPTFGLFITSFRPLDQANNSGWWEIFSHPSYIKDFSFSNYTTAITQANLGEAFINSMAIALPATFIPLLVAAFAAYAFTFMEFPGRDWLFLLIVGLLVVPNYVAFVPVLRIYSNLHISGFAGVWLAHIGFGMSLAIYILRNYMATLPKTVIESAKIDGASHFQTFFRLILPMSVPALASFAIFQFLWVWNDLLVALVFIGPGPNAPLTVAVKNNLLGQAGAGWNLVTAGGFFSMIVPIIVFLSLQRFFVRGLTAGAVKG
ncbi:MAG: alpha-glucoside transport system permease protein [Nocardioidaceae bacterium]|nr:alpha-glucoside transport system permease protein [Nocardioidaceae bacterium]